MINKKRSKKTIIRYSRWAVKALFIMIFVVPFYGLAGATPLYVYSLSNLNQPIFALPYGQSVCATWLVKWGNAGPGAWLICPVGGLEVLFTAQTAHGAYLIPLTIIAIFMFLIPIILLGNVFCSWVCPFGSIIDLFDKSIERFMPKTDRKREKRREQDKEKKKTGKSLACPTCPLGNLLANNWSTKGAYGVLVGSLVGSAIFRFPVFCTICPIGISTRGMIHLKAVTTITGKILPIIIELWTIPVVAILLSLREKRYFCRKICPVGAILNITGSFNPFIKPTVNPEKCIMQGCPKDCEDYKLGYCGACRQIDQKRCEKVCPQGIDLVDKGSLAKCTKCLECYIQCEHDAIELKPFGTPDAVSWFRRLKNKLKKLLSLSD